MNNAVILGTGAYVPSRVIPNSWFNQQLGEDVDTWLKANVEIYERRWCEENESTADLCEKAARMALTNAGISANELSMVIVATDTPEYISPSTAAVVQYRIGAEHAGSFDLNTACAGFVAAFDTASKFIQADQRHQYILVIGAYAMSKYLDMSDKKTVTLFADGAGAVVLKAVPNTVRGTMVSIQRTKGEYHDWMGIYGGGTRFPLNQQAIANKDHLLKFVKKFPKELNPTMWTEMASQMCKDAGISVQDVSLFVLTQINVHAIRETLALLNVPVERAITNMHYFGYTGSAAIPMALHRAIEEKRVEKGQWIMMIGSGGGLAFAGTLLKY